MLIKKGGTVKIRYCIVLIAFSCLGQPAWDKHINFEEIEERLQKEEIREIKDIRSYLKKQGKAARGTHVVKLVTLKSGLKAVFKTESASYGEVAAYEIAKELGLRLVPPTIFKELPDGERGSLQFFVESSIDLTRASRKALYKKLSHKDLCDTKLLYFLLCQWDTHPGNQIIAKHDHQHYIALIDNGGILSLTHTQKLRTSSFYASTLEALKQLSNEKLAALWAQYPKQERRSLLIERIAKCRDTILAIASSEGTIIR